MLDNHDHTGHDGAGDAPMTLLMLNKSYWLYEGAELLNDLLFGRGSYPFKVRCLVFEDLFALNRFAGKTVEVPSLWRINPDVVERLRQEELLIEVFSTDV